MKKIILFAAFGVVGLVSAKNTDAKDLKTNLKESKSIIFYNPIRITSSCGYTEFIELHGSPISCIEVEINRMEEECYAPWEGWGYA